MGVRVWFAVITVALLVASPDTQAAKQVYAILHDGHGTLLVGFPKPEGSGVSYSGTTPNFWVYCGEWISGTFYPGSVGAIDAPNANEVWVLPPAQPWNTTSHYPAVSGGFGATSIAGLHGNGCQVKASGSIRNIETGWGNYIDAGSYIQNISVDGEGVTIIARAATNPLQGSVEILGYGGNICFPNATSITRYNIIQHIQSLGGAITPGCGTNGVFQGSWTYCGQAPCPPRNLAIASSHRYPNEPGEQRVKQHVFAVQSRMWHVVLHDHG